MIDLDVTFSSKLWKYSGKSAWYFVTLPQDIANHVKFTQQRYFGFGTVRLVVKVGESEWKTSLFPDKKSGSYFLPIKAEIRKKESLRAGDDLTLNIRLTPNI